MELNIQNTKIELIHWLTTLEDVVLIQKIVELRKQERQDWQDQLSDAEKQSVERGLVEAQQGKLKSNSEAEKIYAKWL